MILGIGCDIIELERIQKALQRQGERFLEFILTPEERLLCSRFRDPTHFLAGRFTAKEALSKALGCGIGKEFSWHSSSVLQDSRGKPFVSWNIDAQTLFGVTKTHLSISHSTTVAMAYALLEG